MPIWEPSCRLRHGWDLCLLSREMNITHFYIATFPVIPLYLALNFHIAVRCQVCVSLCCVGVQQHLRPFHDSGRLFGLAMTAQLVMLRT